MRALITGITGFVGGHLAELLVQQGGWDIWGVTRSGSLSLPHLREHVHIVNLDLMDASRVSHTIAQVQPEVIFHLAGQAFVPESFEAPAATLTTNILTQLNLFLAIIEQRLSCRVLVVSSNEVYGIIAPDAIPVDENTPLRPATPYGVSKLTQDMLGLQYYLSHRLDVVRVRPFNHIGPRQNERFVASSFARQIVRIEAGMQPAIIKVGNLSAQRDFTDVRDMVRAYVRAVEAGESGEVYNLGSGRPVSIQTLLNTLLSASTATIEVQTDTERMRPVDVPLVECDAGRFRLLTGWEPQISLEQTLCDVLADWREHIHARSASC